MPDSYVITLIHGTWAPKASWTRVNSFFRRRLARWLDRGLQYRVFSWSGDNTHSGRLSASEALISFVETGLRQHPESQHLLIAHSHGGNVALHAVQSPRLETRIAGVVCLSTPFQRLEDASTGLEVARSVRGVILWCCVLAWCAVVAVAPIASWLGFAAAVDWMLPPMVEGLVSDVAVWIVVLGMLAMVLLGQHLASLQYQSCWARVMSYFEDVDRISDGAAKRIADSFPVQPVTGVPFYCVTFMGDEARFGLATRQAVTSAPFIGLRLTRFLGPVVLGVLLGTGGCAVVQLLAIQTGLTVNETLGSYLVAIPFMAGLSFLLGWLALWLASTMLAPIFGMFGMVGVTFDLRHGLRWRASFSARPPAQEVEIRRESPVKVFRRVGLGATIGHLARLGAIHSLPYRDDLTIERIAEWIRRREELRKPRAAS